MEIKKAKKQSKKMSTFFTLKSCKNILSFDKVIIKNV